MKKLFSLILYSFLGFGSIFAQLSGDGSLDDPYTGELTSGDFSISGTIYFDEIIVSGGTLTIEPGTTLFGLNPTSSIVVSETGSLMAVGTADSKITFTADNDGDGVPSPFDTPNPSETWRNILFDWECSGISVIDHAVIENGTGDEYGYGGGIDIWGDNITISNSTIRNCNNELGDGGGIYAQPSGNNVKLENLKVYSNIAVGYGGGICTYGNVIITGCELSNNTAVGGAGIFFYSAGSISNSIIRDHEGEGIVSYDSDPYGLISNCVIRDNTTGIYFYGEKNVINSTILNNETGIVSASGNAPKIVNTILWGNTIQYSIESGANLELAYCGIQGEFEPGTNGIGNKPLSSINNTDSGPNFVDPSSNARISSWLAPVVDGGITSYSGLDAPVLDFDGNLRIGETDIGAYEFTYFIWTGATSIDWLTPGNWVNSPPSISTTIVDNQVIIPVGCENYPTASILSLSNRSRLVVEPGAGLTVTGATNVGTGCTFLLKSDATGTANFITGSSVSGSFTVELFLAGGGGPNYKWHYVATPIPNAPKAVLTTNINNPNNLLDYRENKVTTDKMTGWNWHDGHEGSTVFTILANTRGYNVYVPTDKTAVFVTAGTNNILRAQTFSISGISFSGTDPEESGWNLVGNPFTSAVNANEFLFGKNFETGKDSTDRAVYFTKNNKSCAWSVGGNIGINGATNIIPPMQGFFVHTKASGPLNTLRIPATARLHAPNTLLYKGKAAKSDSKGTRTNPSLKLNVSDNGSFTDETVIYFFDDATQDFDGDYDAYKWLAKDPAHPQVYSIMQGNKKLGINGLPNPVDVTTVPLNLRIGAEKNYTINVLDLQNFDDYYVTLVHGTNRIDLKANSSYTFLASPGTITNMSVEFKNSFSTDINSPTKDNTTFWYSNNILFIKAASGNFEAGSTITVYDLSGRMVYMKKNISLPYGEIFELPLNLRNGLYICKLSKGNFNINRKIVVVE